MKMKIIAIAATNFFISGIANADEIEQRKSAEITVSVDKTAPVCGIMSIDDYGVLNRDVNYSIIGPKNNTNPYVNITEWDAKKDTLNPKITYLKNIGFEFGKYGRPVEFTNDEDMVNMTFSLNKREDKNIGPEVSETSLTMTITCFNANDPEYQLAQKHWNENGGPKKLAHYNKTMDWDFETNSKLVGQYKKE